MTGETLDRSIGRRTVLGGVALAATAVGAAACATGATPDTQANPTAKAVGIGGATPPPTAAAAGQIGAASDVPVGSGKIFNGTIVVTQPTSGSFKAFSATCTHQGCAVSSVTSGGISCPCHGSLFSINDGSVINGPATKPLAPMKVDATDGTLKIS